MTVRVRIAPSPTGSLHIGTARTALFNWLFARHYGGEFILRIEDTDVERSDKKYEKDIIEGLRWLDLEWDNKELYRQSDHIATYRSHIEILLDSGKAFWCHHSKKELDEEHEMQMKNDEPQRHLCDHKNDERGKKRGEIIRLAVPWDSDRKIEFRDLIRGNIAFEEHLLGDLSIAKNLNTPLYNFAVVADDSEMAITHVIRGEDHISNTPKQILIYEALQKEKPQFAHLPLILAPDRSKLSKRNGAISILEYRKDYLSQALVNFMGLLGYTYDREVLPKEEMAKQFDIAKVHKAGAIFDTKKLNWLNAKYVRQLDPEELRSIVNVPELSDDAIGLVAERLEKLSDVTEFAYLWNTPDDFNPELLRWKKNTLEESITVLTQTIVLMEEDTLKDKDELREKLDALGSKVGGRGLVYWPLRVALTGKEFSPDPVDVAFVIEKKEVLQRIKSAIKKSKTSK